MLLLLSLSSLLPGTALAGDVEIHDTLYTSSSATTVYGGTFTGAGWRIDDSNSRMFWDFGQQVDSGDISVVIDGITLDSLTTDNNHLIELFDQGGHFDGCTRAINLRVYGEGDPSAPASDWGGLKLKVWDSVNVAEQRADAPDWDGLPHTWRITWNPTEAILYRDGVVLIDEDVSGIDTRVGTLWLPLDDWENGYGAPLGSTYSKLDLSATVPVVDTGPADDGNPNTFTPTDDTTAVSWEDGVYSDFDDLNAEGDGANATAVVWTRFDLSSVTGTITSATLTLHAMADSHADGDGGSLYSASDTSWNEDSLTWANQPALGSVIGSYPHVNPSDTETFDVTGQVYAGSAATFALLSTGSNGAHFSSKEDGDDTMGPVLTITTSASSGGDNGGGNGGDGDTATSGNGGNNGGNGGTADTAGNGGDGSSSHPGTDTGSGVKSGCSTAGGEPASPALLALAGVCFAVRRKKRP